MSESTKTVGFDALIEAFTIFRKYDNPSFPTHCEHDVLYVCVDPAKVSDEDKERLKELSFRGLDNGQFISTRYGSA